MNQMGGSQVGQIRRELGHPDHYRFARFVSRVDIPL